MSYEIFDTLESKIQQAISSLSLSRDEVDMLRSKNGELSAELQSIRTQLSGSEEENIRLRTELSAWKDRLQSLLEKINDIH